MLLRYTRKVLDGRLGEVVDMDKMQYRLMPRRGTLDAVFVLKRQMKNEVK